MLKKSGFLSLFLHIRVFSSLEVWRPEKNRISSGGIELSLISQPYSTSAFSLVEILCRELSVHCDVLALWTLLDTIQGGTEKNGTAYFRYLPTYPIWRDGESFQKKNEPKIIRFG